MDVSALSVLVYELFVVYTFGNIWLASVFMISFFVILQYKLGVSADVIGASTSALLIGTGATMLPYDLLGIISIFAGIILYVAVWKLFRA